MKLFRITDCRFINDLSGYGASSYGGRWNSKGTPVLYTAQNSSLAQLEILARFDIAKPVPELCLLQLEVPMRSSITLKAGALPAGWNTYTSPFYLKKLGDRFVKDNKYLVLKVPSVVNPHEYNYLINPAHKDFSRIKVLETTRIQIDKRLILKH